MRTLVVASFLAASASAHTVWIERTADGFVARFGEIDEGERDALEPGQRWNLARTSCASPGAPPTATVGADGVALAGACTSPRLVHADMPVHGKGEDAGRAIFAARFATDSGFASPVDSTLGLDLVPVAGEAGAVRVVASGIALAGHEVVVVGPAKVRRELVADVEGVVRLESADAGTWTFTAYVEERRKGRHAGSAYAKIWHVATIALERP